MAHLLTAINVTRGVQLTECGRIAETLYPRLVGLLRDRALKHGEGLWIKPCNSIHSIGMKFRFDAIFLDKDLRVVHLVREMKAWRISKVIFSAQSVLELPAGLISQTATELRDQFEMQRVAS
jgi:uncharacterized membrane protein (UPF0127 family)